MSLAPWKHRLENPQRLATATARYFSEMEPGAATQESSLAHCLVSAVRAIDFDNEL